MNKNNVLIIYHSQDLDGLMSAAIARYYYNRYDDIKVRSVGYNYGQPRTEIETVIKEGDIGTIILTDISFNSDTGSVFRSWQESGIDVVWIDHHKTAIEDSGRWGIDVEGLRRIDVAASVLTWEWFADMVKNNPRFVLPWRDTPLIIQAVGDYDVWNTESEIGWEAVLDIQYGLRAYIGLDPDRAYTMLVNRLEDEDLDDIINGGRTVRLYECLKFEAQAKDNAFQGWFCGYKAMFINTIDFGSQIFKSFDSDPDIQVLVCFSPNIRRGAVRFGVYRHPLGGKDVDCGKWAKMLGGGGHAGAAGFEISIYSVIWKYFIDSREIVAALGIKSGNWMKKVVKGSRNP